MLKNKLSLTSVFQIERDCQYCRTRSFMDTKLMMCQIDIANCEWAIPYKKDLSFCKHPSAPKFNKSSK